MKQISLFVLLCYFSNVICCYRAHAQVINTFAGIGPTGPTGSFSGDGGPAALAGINRPGFVALDTAGNVYFNDKGNFRVRKVNAAGIITTVCGDGVSFDSGDGGPATAAEITSPVIAIDQYNNIYLSCGSTRLRKIDATGTINTIAGNGTLVYSGDGGPATAATLYGTGAVAVDTAGNIFLGTYPGIRRIDRFGIIHAFAGTSTVGFSGDGGPATAAEFNTIDGICVDKTGNLYIADALNYRIRKVNTTGVITTIVGNGTNGYSGDGGPATLAEIGRLRQVALDTFGNLYIADQTNEVIRKIDTAGIITTIAGNHSAGYGGDHGPATAAEFYSPWGIAVAPNGIIYIADEYNNRVRVISSNLFFTGGRYQPATTCSGVSLSLDTMLAANDSSAGVHEYWGLLSPPHHGTATASYTTLSTGGVVYPVGLTYTPTPGYTGNDTLSVRITDTVISDTSIIYITVNPLPHAGNITGPDTVCRTMTITLSDTATGGAWSASNGNALVSSGAVHGVMAGLDTIRYIMANACGADTARYAVEVKVCPSAVPAMRQATYGIQLSPNPNTGAFTVTLTSSCDEDTHIVITNTMGERVKEINTAANHTTEVLLNAPAGIYFVTAVTAHGSWSGKVVVTR